MTTLRWRQLVALKRAHAQQLPPQDQLLDLRRAFVEAEADGVAEQAFDGVFAQVADAAVDVRPLSSDVCAILKPSPALPSSRSPGTRTPSKKSAAVLDACSPSFSGITCRSRPADSPSTTNAAIPLCRAPGSVCANTTM